MVVVSGGPSGVRAFVVKFGRERDFAEWKLDSEKSETSKSTTFSNRLAYKEQAAPTSPRDGAACDTYNGSGLGRMDMKWTYRPKT